jgi:hypothetical protein
VKSKDLEVTFDVPRDKYQKSGDNKNGFIKISGDFKTADDLELKAYSEVSYHSCGETDLAQLGMPSQGEWPQGEMPAGNEYFSEPKP